jgi:hypothetical protein
VCGTAHRFGWRMCLACAVVSDFAKSGALQCRRACSRVDRKPYRAICRFVLRFSFCRDVLRFQGSVNILVYTCASGSYHFTSTAFVNQAQFGYTVWSANFGTILYGLHFTDTFYCTAPVVASPAQSQVLFWVIGKDCCTAMAAKCWDKFSSPGSITGAFPLARSADMISARYTDARAVASLKLAQASNSTAAELVALPSVFVELNSDPDAFARMDQASGFTFSVIMAFLWPLVWFAVGGAFVIYVSR